MPNVQRKLTRPRQRRHRLPTRQSTVKRNTAKAANPKRDTDRSGAAVEMFRNSGNV
jgi:hypothetical protein